MTSEGHKVIRSKCSHRQEASNDMNGQSVTLSLGDLRAKIQKDFSMSEMYESVRLEERNRMLSKELLILNLPPPGGGGQKPPRLVFFLNNFFLKTTGAIATKLAIPSEPTM